MNKFTDLFIALACILLLAVGYFSFWILVAIVVGLILYAGLRIYRTFQQRRPRKWK